jgi:hypothetical protein
VIDERDVEADEETRAEEMESSEEEADKNKDEGTLGELRERVAMEDEEYNFVFDEMLTP